MRLRNLVNQAFEVSLTWGATILISVPIWLIKAPKPRKVCCLEAIDSLPWTPCNLSTRYEMRPSICDFRKFPTPTEACAFFRPLEEGRMLSSLCKARIAWWFVTNSMTREQHDTPTSCSFLGSSDPSMKTNVPNNSMIQLRAKVWAFILPPLGVGMSCRINSSALSVCSWSGRRKT